MDDTSPKEEAQLTERDAYILDKAKDFTPLEIQVLLEREGFQPVTHGRIYQILNQHGVTPKTNRPVPMRKKSE